jgi:hypothetical protein
MPPRASILLPLANAGGYRAKRRCRVEPASSRRCVRRKRPPFKALLARKKRPREAMRLKPVFREIEGRINDEKPFIGKPLEAEVGRMVAHVAMGKTARIHEVCVRSLANSRGQPIHFSHFHAHERKGAYFVPLSQQGDAT